MTVIGKGVIEVSTDTRKMSAGIDDAKRSLRSLGITANEATKGQSASIDRYVKSLGVAAVTAGKTGRELELYKLALKGANEAQLKAADGALRMSESYAKSEAISQKIKTGFLAIGAAAASMSIAGAVAFDHLIKKTGEYQDMAEKTGDNAQNIASLALAAGTKGIEMDSVVAGMVKLTKTLTGVDDESEAAGAAIKSLGLDLKEFKNLSAADQIETVAKAMEGFAEGSGKTAVALALFGKSGAEMLPFLKELGQEGARQVILTKEQIENADAYSDAQAKLKTQLSLTAQSIAADLLPQLTNLLGRLEYLIKETDGTSIAIESIKTSFNGAVIVFQTIAIVASNVGFVLQAMGREIGAIAAQVSALGRLDLNGFTAISDAVKADGVRARAELDKFEAAVMGTASGAVSSVASAAAGGGRGFVNPQSKKPKLSFDGAVKTSKSGSGDKGKSQLDSDLKDIKNQQDELIAIYANGQKMVEALHSAGLVEDEYFYTAKRHFLELNTTAQEDAFKKEIERLQKEKVSGKDKIENEQKIADIQEKIFKLREDAATNLEILSIQENANLEKVAKSYRDAEEAAQDYLDTLKNGQDRELAGMGAGNEERSRRSGRSSIEDRYSGKRQDLEKSKSDAELSGTFGDSAQKKYDEELNRINTFEQAALNSYDDYYQKLAEMRNDWSVGASEAMKNYMSQSADIASQSQKVFENAFSGMEDAMVNFVMTGKMDFRSLAESIISDIVRIIIKQQISNMLGVVTGGGSGGGGGGGGFFTSLITSAFGGGKASGGPVQPGVLYRVNENRPELLTVAGKQYLMMGNQSGTIDPNPKTGGGNTLHQTVNFINSAPIDRRTQAQISATTYSAAAKAANRMK